MNKPLVDKEAMLCKFSGKGGWTYVHMPEIAPEKNAPFGWLRVKGSIDNIAFTGLRLMPKGDGTLFLPVNATMRKKLEKQEGDIVMIKLFRDDIPDHVPEEILVCLKESPDAFAAFFKLTDSRQKGWISYIYEAKKEAERIRRIAQMIEQMVP